MAAASQPSVPRSRRERRKQEVHDRLLAAAVGLFEGKGFAETTAFEIAERADVAEKTFYNHFPTKQHLVRELAEAVVAEGLESLEDARKQPLSTRRRIEYFAERAAKRVADSGAIRRTLIVEIIRVSQVEGSGPERGRQLHEAWEALLRDGVERGDVGDRYSIDFLTEMAVASFGGVATSWATQPGYPLRERLRECAALLGDAVEAGVARATD